MTLEGGLPGARSAGIIEVGLLSAVFVWRFRWGVWETLEIWPLRTARRDRNPDMARRSKQSILKRQRELKKAEKQALKREKRAARESTPAGGDQVATKDDLEGYGFPTDEEPEEKEEGGR